MPPLLILVLVIVFLFGLFWGGTLIAQGYLYQQPTGQLPARAAVAAVLVGGFLAGWVWLDKQAPEKYDVLYRFKGEDTKAFSEFEAIRWQFDPGGKGVLKDTNGKPVEKAAGFKRTGSGKTTAFAEEKTGQPFKVNDSTMMTAALLVKVDESGDPTRFNADLKKGTNTYVTTRKRFTAETGGRYIWGDQLERSGYATGVMYIPSTGTVALAILINARHFLLWFVAFWLVLRFSWGHALGFAAVFGLVAILVLLPMLFDKNRARASETTDARPVLGGRGA